LKTQTDKNIKMIKVTTARFNYVIYSFNRTTEHILFQTYIVFNTDIYNI